ncbi:MAG: V-type ATP synthase subunit I [Spirochaetaceae bacterium]|jgi:V/A-type H+-transporting ATPase subunit I|nr:V-type ATP synthase subunit I [Spirochaetaceae bacterium]
MLKPVKMKQIVVTLLSQDVDAVIKFFGRNGSMQFSQPAAIPGETGGEGRPQPVKNSEERPPSLVALERLRKAADFLGVEAPSEPFAASEPPSDADIRLSGAVVDEVEKLENDAYEEGLKQERLENAISALSGFSGVDSPVSRLKDLSFLSLRVGKVEPQKQDALKQGLGNRAVVIPLGEDNGEILALSSKKGRFVLDSELAKQDFLPLALPEGVTGTPDETLRELRAELSETTARLDRIEAEKKNFTLKHGDSIRALYASCLMAKIMEEVKSRFAATNTAFQIKGWVEASEAKTLADELSQLTGGRAAIRAFDPYEVGDVATGGEKIPVALKHGAFAKTFQSLVLSYGAPLYGAVDPTPFTAFFFSLLFAVMFGDVGQGAVLFLLGMLFASNWGKAKFSGMKAYAGPLKIIGPLSMLTGLLYGSVFANETLLERPTAAVTGFLATTGFGRTLGIVETGRILNLMPEKDNIGKIFMFFGFTVAIGVILNSIGLILFVLNNLAMRRYEKAYFSRYGIAGICFFWYAISIGIRAIVQKDAFVFGAADIAGLLVPVFFIVTGPLIWSIITAKRPLFPEGVFAFFMEGIVDILETLSGTISNTVSFLRVGAFALSHAVLSFIIFTMADKVGHAILGGLWQTVVFIFGNAVIIFLEAMIVAIQVVRLQYYEFFSKFFTETGTEFKPFRFSKAQE